ncbi:MAG: DUF3987 domain-containing protein [Oscillospiraceae bacterium]
MEFTLSVSNVIGKQNNAYYRDIRTISNEQEMFEAVQFDHICGHFQNCHRQKKDFIDCDCIVMDCDNDHSDNSEDWYQLEDYAQIFSDITFVAVTSRNHMKQKKDKSARPRHHIYFPVSLMKDWKECVALKNQLHEKFPFFDDNALDAPRFIYGCLPDKILWHDGTMDIQDYLFLIQEHKFEIKEGKRNHTLFTFAVKILKRLGKTEETKKAFREQADKCNPPLETEELRSIWRSALKYYQRIQKQQDYVPPEKYTETEWVDPIPFSKYNLAKFPVDALPLPIALYASAVAESTQTPVDMAGTQAIAILSTCIQGKYKIQCKLDWIEPLNTYGLIIAPPSERKSAVTHSMLRPVNHYEVQYNMRNAAAFETNKMQRRMLERRQKMIEDQFVKGKATQADVDQIAQDIANFIEKQPMQLYVDDITPEKLVSVIVANKGKAALISTEGGIFDTLAGTYSKIVNIDVMLKGYSGDTIRVDRIGRESENVMNPALTILLMAQPNVVAAVLGNQTFRGRGLTARFLYCIPESYVGKRQYHSATIPDEIYQNYEQLIINLLDDDRENELILLSPEADKLIADYATELEPKLVTDYAEMADWAGKLIGNTLRIAGLLCRASVYRDFDFLSDDDEPLIVSQQIMENAIRLSRYFLNHAQAAYAVLPEDAMYQKADHILQMIKEKHLTEFDRREAMRFCRSFKTVAEIQPVLDQLEDYGYIARQPEKVTIAGRPPLPKYFVNPKI